MWTRSDSEKLKRQNPIESHTIFSESSPSLWKQRKRDPLGLRILESLPHLWLELLAKQAVFRKVQPICSICNEKGNRILLIKHKTQRAANHVNRRTRTRKIQPGRQKITIKHFTMN